MFKKIQELQVCLIKSTSDHSAPTGKYLNLTYNQKKHFETKITFGHT